MLIYDIQELRTLRARAKSFRSIAHDEMTQQAKREQAWRALRPPVVHVRANRDVDTLTGLGAHQMPYLHVRSSRALHVSTTYQEQR